MRTLIVFIAILSIPVFAFAQKTGQARMEKATLGAGCFWCVEAVFERLDGVQSVIAGYAE